MTGLIRGLGRGKRYFIGSKEVRHTPDLIISMALIPLSILSHALQSPLKALLTVVAADERVLDYPEDLTDQTTAKNGLYAHRGRDSRTSCNRAARSVPPLARSLAVTEPTEERIYPHPLLLVIWQRSSDDRRLDSAQPLRRHAHAVAGSHGIRT